MTTLSRRNINRANIEYLFMTPGLTFIWDLPTSTTTCTFLSLGPKLLLPCPLTVVILTFKPSPLLQIISLLTFFSVHSHFFSHRQNMTCTIMLDLLIQIQPRYSSWQLTGVFPFRNSYWDLEKKEKIFMIKTWLPQYSTIRCRHTNAVIE